MKSSLSAIENIVDITFNKNRSCIEIGKESDKVTEIERFNKNRSCIEIKGRVRPKLCWQGLIKTEVVLKFENTGRMGANVPV